MKKICLTITVAVFLLFLLNGVQAQTTQTKPNQVELVKKLIGKWQAEWTDTIYNWEAKTFGMGLECHYIFKSLAKDKIVLEGKQLWGYDSKLDKYIGIDLMKGQDIQILALWFTSDNKYIGTDFNNISDPDKSSWKVEGEIKSSDAFSETWFVKGKPFTTIDYKRIK
jgi:hypothetical protein